MRHLQRLDIQCVAICAVLPSKTGRFGRQNGLFRGARRYVLQPALSLLSICPPPRPPLVAYIQLSGVAFRLRVVCFATLWRAEAVWLYWLWLRPFLVDGFL